MLIKYYFWRQNYSGDWQPEGNLHGYNSEQECLTWNRISINLCQQEKLAWTILEAIPTSVKNKQ